VIIHKLTDVILEADQNDSQSLELVHRFQVSGSVIVLLHFKQEDGLGAANPILFPVQLVAFCGKSSLSSLAYCYPAVDSPVKIVLSV